LLLKPVPLLSDLSESLGGGLRAISGYDGKPGNEISVLDVIGFVAKTQDIDFDPSLIVKGIETFKFLDSIKPQDGIPLGRINFDANGSSVKSGLPNISLIGSTLPSQGGLSIPLLQNPSDTVLNMLLGKPVDLFNYRLPEFKLQGTITQIVPVIGPLGVSIGGTFDISTNLGFGFDTSGFKSNNIKQGIYFTDNVVKGKDLPEFNFGIGPVIGAGLQLAVASIDIFSGMKLNLGIDLKDTNKDGKLSLNEFDGLNSFNYTFNLSGPTVGGSVKILGANVFSPQTPRFPGIDLGTISGDKINSEVTRLTKGIEEIKNSFKDGIDDIKKASDIKVLSPAELAEKAGEVLGDGAEAVKDAAAKGARNLDPSNKEGPVGRALPELDPTNPKGAAGEAVKAAEDVLAMFDPFNPNSPVGKVASQAKAAVAAELKKFENAVAELDFTNSRSSAGRVWTKTKDLFSLVDPNAPYIYVINNNIRTNTSVVEEYNSLLRKLDENRAAILKINTEILSIASDKKIDAQKKRSITNEKIGDIEDIRLHSKVILNSLKTKNWSDLIKQELLANGIKLEGLDSDDVFVSSTGEDTLKGNGGNDNLSSGGGFDKLSGGRGNDYLNAGDGLDYLTGDSGNDQLHGGTGKDDLYGYSDDYYFAVVNDPTEPDNDSLYGGSGDDFLDGGKGDDLLRGGDGSSLDPNNPDKTDKDMLIGGSGNDTLYGGEDDDRLFGGADNDLLYGEAGNDLLFGDEGNDLLDGGTGIDTLRGGNDSDTLHGSANNDYLYGDPGEDYLYGDGGNDVLKGGSEGDLLDGGDDADELWGEEDVDTLYGGRGTDYLYGGQATDYLYGGLEDDVLYGGIAGNDAFDTSVDYLYGEEGNDRIYGQAGNDELDGGEGNDSLYLRSCTWKFECQFLD
jgi:hypothetical protein